MRDGSYPTPAQVSVFVGNVWVDDAYRIEVRDQNQLIPLYGYADKEFTAVAQGKRIVQGSLIINYRYPEYLLAAIDGHGHKKVEMESAVALAHALQNADITERIAILEQARMNGVGKEMREVFTSKYLKEVTFNSPEDLRTRFLLERWYPSATSLPSTMQMDPKREISLRIWFDMQERARYYTSIEGVRFVGRAMTVSNAAGGGDASSSGQPLYEIYTFFAKRIENRKVQRWTRDPTSDAYGSSDQTEILNGLTPTPVVEGSES